MQHVHVVALEQVFLCARVTFTQIPSLNSTPIQCERVCVNVL